MQEIAFGHYLGASTVSSIIKETTKVLWDVLQPVVLVPPTLEQWKNIEADFFKKWNVPNCVGALDGKHVNIQAPANAGSEFFNYKKQHSIVLMASCDANYQFTLVDIGAAGGSHDSIIFTDSPFGKAILKNELNLPEAKRLPGTDRKLPHFFVADAAFPLHPNIMKPYPDVNLTPEQRIYNYRISRARRTIESSFGILSQRWRILRTNIIADLATCSNIVMATVVLHNFIMQQEMEITEGSKRYCPRSAVEPEVLGNDERLRGVGRVGSNNSARSTFLQRNHLLEYFNSEIGSVDWQENMIMTGSVPNNF